MAIKKPEVSGGGDNGFATALFVLIGIVLILMFIFGMSDAPNVSALNMEYFFDKFATFGEDTLGWREGGLDNMLYTLKIASGVLSLFFAGLAFWLFLRLLEMEGEHADHVYHHAIDNHNINNQTNEASFLGKLIYGEDADLIEHKNNKVLFTNEEEVNKEPKLATDKWNMVVKHSKSSNPSDWKLAVIEADTILDALTEGRGFAGFTLGERLKSADKGTFKTLDHAWEAHLIRNKIAHDGIGFNLSERDRDHILKLYEEVFREFDYI